MLKNKAERINVEIVEADTFYPSSKTCSSCGSVDSDLSLSDRIYYCSVCGHTQDRDLNAAINLRTLAVGRGGEVKRLWRYCKTPLVGAGIVEARR